MLAQVRLQPGWDSDDEALYQASIHRERELLARAAIFLSCSQARCARPSAVFDTRNQKAASSTAVTSQIAICLYDTVTS